MSGLERMALAHVRTWRRCSVGRVAVVDRRPHAGHAEGREAARLILRESLRRIEVERARLRVAGDRVQHRQVEGQRLAARRAGGDGDVLAARGCRPRLGLVLEEARDALALERGHDPLVELRRQRCRRRLPRGLRADVRDLLAREQFVGERDLDGHALSVAAGSGR